MECAINGGSPECKFLQDNIKRKGCRVKNYQKQTIKIQGLHPQVMPNEAYPVLPHQLNITREKYNTLMEVKSTTPQNTYEVKLLAKLE